MKRIIKFRGQLTNSNEWVYGYYQLTGWKPDHLSRHIIIDENGIRFSVKPESIGQYTGIFNEFNQEIFEGDIVDFAGYSVIKYYEDRFIAEGVIFDNSSMRVSTHFKVIGNITDNANLLKL